MTNKRFFSKDYTKAIIIVVLLAFLPLLLFLFFLPIIHEQRIMAFINDTTFIGVLILILLSAVYLLYFRFSGVFFREDYIKINNLFSFYKININDIEVFKMKKIYSIWRNEQIPSAVLRNKKVIPLFFIDHPWRKRYSSESKLEENNEMIYNLNKELEKRKKYYGISS